MPGYSKSNPSPSSTPPPHVGPPPIDLTEVTEATRRALYDATVAIHFHVPPDTEEWMPFYNADQARLTVVRWAGRWLVTWLSLEEITNDILSPDAKQVVLCIGPDPEAPYGVAFHEV